MLQRTLEKFERFNVIDLYTNKGYSLNQLEAIVGSDKRCIRNYLLANNIEVKGIKNPEIDTSHVLIEGKSGRRFNYKFFDKINTEEKAYWLGFIFADGCITDGRFSLYLQARDVGHLHKFNRSVECIENNVQYHCKKTEGEIYDGYHWNIRNYHFCERLAEYGCLRRKTYGLVFPDKGIFKNENLIKHFIRGYFDGDGCISVTQTGKQINVLGTEMFLNKMNEYLPTKFPSIHKCSGDRNVFEMRSSRRKAYEILHYLYSDATIYLDRKYEKYLEFWRLYGKPYGESVGKNGELCDENTVLTSDIAKGSEEV